MVAIPVRNVWQTCLPTTLKQIIGRRWIVPKANVPVGDPHWLPKYSRIVYIFSVDTMEWPS
eukprot:scaffold31713_cov61-Skeletonema_dohrnii-CCMP3373.AAC.1